MYLWFCRWTTPGAQWKRHLRALKLSLQAVPRFLQELHRVEPRDAHVVVLEASSMAFPQWNPMAFWIFILEKWINLVDLRS